MIDATVRAIYRTAHLGLRALWFMRRPETKGVLVAVWHGGKVLLVRNSYRKKLTLPGGYVRAHEERRASAVRELREEIGLAVQPHRLTHAYHGTHLFEHRKDTLDIFDVEFEYMPEVQIDRREVIWAEFMKPEQALSLDLVPHLQEYLRTRVQN